MSNRDKTIVEAYRSGLTLREIGAQVGMSKQGVRKALDRLGQRRRAPCVAVDAKRDQEIALAYRSGLSVNEVGEKFGICFSTVMRALKRRNEPRRAKHTHGRPAKDARNKALADAYASGKSISEVAEQFGIGRTAADNILRRLGVQKRPPGTVMRTAGALFPLVSPHAEAIIPEGVKITVWQPRPDPRSLRQPEPFFSRGAVLPPSPWVQAITGGL